jgi:hypothetical protein
MPVLSTHLRGRCLVGRGFPRPALVGHRYGWCRLVVGLAGVPKHASVGVDSSSAGWDVEHPGQSNRQAEIALDPQPPTGQQPSRPNAAGRQTQKVAHRQRQRDPRRPIQHSPRHARTTIEHGLKPFVIRPAAPDPPPHHRIDPSRPIRPHMRRHPTEHLPQHQWPGRIGRGQRIQLRSRRTGQQPHQGAGPHIAKADAGIRPGQQHQRRHQLGDATWPQLPRVERAGDPVDVDGSDPLSRAAGRTGWSGRRRNPGPR